MNPCKKNSFKDALKRLYYNDAKFYLEFYFLTSEYTCKIRLLWLFIMCPFMFLSLEDFCLSSIKSDFALVNYLGTNVYDFLPGIFFIMCYEEFKTWAKGLFHGCCSMSTVNMSEIFKYIFDMFFYCIHFPSEFASGHSLFIDVHNFDFGNALEMAIIKVNPKDLESMLKYHYEALLEFIFGQKCSIVIRIAIIIALLRTVPNSIVKYLYGNPKWRDVFLRFLSLENNRNQNFMRMLIEILKCKNLLDVICSRAEDVLFECLQVNSIVLSKFMVYSCFYNNKNRNVYKMATNDNIMCFDAFKKLNNDDYNVVLKVRFIDANRIFFLLGNKNNEFVKQFGLICNELMDTLTSNGNLVKLDSRTFKCLKFLHMYIVCCEWFDRKKYYGLFNCKSLMEFIEYDIYSVLMSTIFVLWDMPIVGNEIVYKNSLMVFAVCYKLLNTKTIALIGQSATKTLIGGISIFLDVVFGQFVRNNYDIDTSTLLMADGVNISSAKEFKILLNKLIVKFLNFLNGDIIKENYVKILVNRIRNDCRDIEVWKDTLKCLMQFLAKNDLSTGSSEGNWRSDFSKVCLNDGTFKYLVGDDNDVSSNSRITSNGTFKSTDENDVFGINTASTSNKCIDGKNRNNKFTVNNIFDFGTRLAVNNALKPLNNDTCTKSTIDNAKCATGSILDYNRKFISGDVSKSTNGNNASDRDVGRVNSVNFGCSVNSDSGNNISTSVKDCLLECTGASGGDVSRFNTEKKLNSNGNILNYNTNIIGDSKISDCVLNCGKKLASSGILKYVSQARNLCGDGGVVDGNAFNFGDDSKLGVWTSGGGGEMAARKKLAKKLVFDLKVNAHKKKNSKNGFFDEISKDAKFNRLYIKNKVIGSENIVRSRDEEANRDGKSKEDEMCRTIRKRSIQNRMIIEEVGVSRGESAKVNDGVVTENRLFDNDSIEEYVYSLDMRDYRFKKEVMKSKVLKNYFDSFEEYIYSFKACIIVELEECIRNELIGGDCGSKYVLYKVGIEHIANKDQSTILIEFALKDNAGEDCEVHEGCLVGVTTDGDQEYVAIVHEKKKKPNGKIIITVMTSLKNFNGYNNERSFVIGKSTYALRILYDCTSILRQWKAMHYLVNNDKALFGNIIKPNKEFFVNTNKKEKGSLSIGDVYNESQKEAIAHAYNSLRFCLIQGPPGTGKTKTLLGILKLYLKRKCVLVCTPNNKAVDEIIITFLSEMNNGDMGRFCDGENRSRQLLLLRVGNVESISEQVLKMSNDKSFSQRGINFVIVNNSTNNKYLNYNSNFLISAGDNTSGGGGGGGLVGLVQSADVVFTTLNSSNSSFMMNARSGGKKFPVVIVDEATQSVEPDALIPLTFGCEKLIMIGDPKQLNAMVNSPKARELNYSRSLFERWIDCGVYYHTLNLQYRMHPDISEFSNYMFYNAKIKNALPPSSFQRPWHDNPQLGPLIFFNVTGKEMVSNSSIYNPKQIDFIVKLTEYIIKEYKVGDDICIITPYKSQKKKLLQKLKDRGNCPRVETIDSFQGQERDIIIFSTVRSNGNRSIGFTSSLLRLNVALTRAKSSLWIVGNSSTLSISNEWKELIDYISKKKKFVQQSQINFIK